MGVDVRIVVYSESKTKAERACSAAFERFAQLDTIMSDYRADSELMQLCAKSGGHPVSISKDLFKVLQRSQELARESAGAFDVTCSPLIRLWRSARKSKTLPDTQAVETARKLVGWRYLKLNPAHHTAQLLIKCMLLDLGGIGKGYADDCAQEMLKRNGVSIALVQAGGDIVLSNPPPGKRGWNIEMPNSKVGDELPLLPFVNCAISTSGDTEQFVEIGGKHYSHIIDPRTGQALQSRFQVTIVAKDGLTSDGLSTAVSVLGETVGRMLVRAHIGCSVRMRTCNH